MYMASYIVKHLLKQGDFIAKQIAPLSEKQFAIISHSILQIEGFRIVYAKKAVFSKLM